jgi:hypothetical protein
MGQTFNIANGRRKSAVNVNENKILVFETNVAG